MGVFVYKDYDELLNFCKSLGMYENVEKDKVIELSEERLKNFLKAKGYFARHLDSLKK